MKHVFPSGKAIGIALLIFLLALLLGLAACTGPVGPVGPAGLAGPVGPAGPPGAAAPQFAAAIMLIPYEAEIPAKGIVTVYGSGFAPGRSVSIELVGTWKLASLPKAEVKDPPVGLATPNEYGAFTTRLDMAVILKSFTGGPGVYTLKAVQTDGAMASAPLVVVEPKK